ncbi:MAG: hypothetical protein ACOX69_06905 [Coriobacteriales bacterium]
MRDPIAHDRERPFDPESHEAFTNLFRLSWKDAESFHDRFTLLCISAASGQALTAGLSKVEKTRSSLGSCYDRVSPDAPDDESHRAWALLDCPPSRVADVVRKLNESAESSTVRRIAPGDPEWPSEGAFAQLLLNSIPTSDEGMHLMRGYGHTYLVYKTRGDASRPFQFITCDIKVVRCGVPGFDDGVFALCLPTTTFTRGSEKEGFRPSSTKPEDLPRWALHRGSDVPVPDSSAPFESCYVKRQFAKRKSSVPFLSYSDSRGYDVSKSYFLLYALDAVNRRFGDYLVFERVRVPERRNRVLSACDKHASARELRSVVSIDGYPGVAVIDRSAALPVSDAALDLLVQRLCELGFDCARADSVSGERLNLVVSDDVRGTDGPDAYVASTDRIIVQNISSETVNSIYDAGTAGMKRGACSLVDAAAVQLAIKHDLSIGKTSVFKTLPDQPVTFVGPIKNLIGSQDDEASGHSALDFCVCSVSPDSSISCKSARLGKLFGLIGSDAASAIVESCSCSGNPLDYAVVDSSGAFALVSLTDARMVPDFSEIRSAREIGTNVSGEHRTQLSKSATGPSSYRFGLWETQLCDGSFLYRVGSRAGISSWDMTRGEPWRRVVVSEGGSHLVDVILQMLDTPWVVIYRAPSHPWPIKFMREFLLMQPQAQQQSG